MQGAERVRARARPLVARAIAAGAARFDVEASEFGRRLANGDVAAWNAFRASLALDIARLLADLEPAIDAIYACPYPGRPGGPVLLIACERPQTPALAHAIRPLNQELGDCLRSAGIELAEALFDVRVLDLDDPHLRRGISPVVDGRQLIPIRVWARPSRVAAPA